MGRSGRGCSWPSPGAVARLATRALWAGGIVAMLASGLAGLWEGAAGCALQDVRSAWHKVRQNKLDAGPCQARFSQMGGPQAEQAVAVALYSASAAVCLALWLLVARRALSALHAGFSLRSRARALWAAVRHRASALWGQSSDPEVARIRREAEAQRLRAALRVIRLSALVFAAFFPFALSDAFSVLVSPYRDRKIIYIYDSEAVPAVLYGIIIVTIEFAPALVTPSLLDHMNVFWSVLWAWRLMVSTSDEYYNKAWIMSQRQCGALLCGNARLSICLQVVVSTAGFARVITDELADGDAIGVDFYTSFPVVFEITTCCIVVVMIWVADQSRWAEARARVEQRHSNNTTHLVFSLLASMCEAVVKLDSELRFLEPSPRLASILLRQRVFPVGASFCNLMSADDAERLRGCLVRSRERDPLVAHLQAAAMLHVDLHDGNGQKFPAELFSGCVLDEDDLPVYLIGIKEDREMPAPCDDQVAPLRAGAAKLQLPGLPEFSRVDREGGSAGKAGSSPSVSASSDEGAGGGGTAFVWLDASRKALPVLRQSVAFAYLGGPLGPCTALRQWLDADELRDFRGWLRDDFPSDLSHTVRLTPPGVLGRYRAKCHLLADSEDPDGPPEAPPGAKAVYVRISELHFRVDRPHLPKTDYHAQAAKLARLAGSETPQSSGGAQQASGGAPPESGAAPQQAPGVEAPQASGGAPPESGVAAARQARGASARRARGAGPPKSGDEESQASSNGAVQARKGAAPAGGADAPQFEEGEKLTAFWFLAATLQIVKVNEAWPCSGLFWRKRDLRSWLAQPAEFLEAVLAVRSTACGEIQPTTIGPFAFHEPDPDATSPPIAFLAEVEVVAVSSSDVPGVPCCVGLRHVRLLPAPASAAGSTGSCPAAAASTALAL